MKLRLLGIIALTTCLVAGIIAAHPFGKADTSGSWNSATNAVPGRPKPISANSWDPKAAAAYLDQREVQWMEWSTAARDHDTFCVSCHTVLPYALSRPVLRRALGNRTVSVNERKLLDNISKRVRIWNEVGPFYTDHDDGRYKATQSRGTESVLNALILATYDAQNGELSDDTKAAFRNMWTLQEIQGSGKGAWSWLQFGLEPWESRDSQYYGATLAAIAIGSAPGKYGSSPEIQTNVKLLREYLGSGYRNQTLANRILLLSASAKLPGLINSEQQKSIIDECLSKQQADGGWSLFPLARTWRDWSLSSLFGAWKRPDGTPQELKSDGYATGLITLTLQQVGIRSDNLHVSRGLTWLEHNQAKPDGSWPGYSLNRRRNPSSMTGRFMTDAATAYAVLALTEANSHNEKSAYSSK